MPTTCALCRRTIPDEQIDEQIHALFTNEELREEYDTIDTLGSANRLRKYIEWIRGIEKLDIDVTTSNRIRDQRG